MQQRLKSTSPEKNLRAGLRGPAVSSLAIFRIVHILYPRGFNCWTAFTFFQILIIAASHTVVTLPIPAPEL